VGVVFFDSLAIVPGRAPAIADWAEPSVDVAKDRLLTQTLAFALDSHNPKTVDRFDANGNIYDRPQREISIHTLGLERLNMLSPEDFATGKPVRVLFGFRFVPGGVLMSMRLGESVVFQDEFVPNVKAFAPSVVIGAQTRDAGGRVSVDNVVVAMDGVMQADPAPVVRVEVLSQESLSGVRREVRKGVDLPQGKFARVLAHVSLKAPADGNVDPWDRKGALYLFGPDNQRYELMRFVTPFRRDWQWTADVTDFLPILQTRRELQLFVDTWSGKFEADVWLEFFAGEPERQPVAVVNLWQGEQIYGDPQNPIENFLTDKIALVPASTTGAKVRLTVTGHGQAPNTDNAAEFLPINRTLVVNGTRFTNLLWNRDNYLSPCRPQQGTWKFDRAGWGPGRMVEPWTVDVSKLFDQNVRTLELKYQTQRYLNQREEAGEPATLWFDGVVVFYK